MKNATVMSNKQNSSAFGVGTSSLADTTTIASTNCKLNLLTSFLSIAPANKLLHFIEEAKAFSFLKEHGAASNEDLISLGVANPSDVIRRLRNVGLPVVTLYASYYVDKDGDRKYAPRLYTVDSAIFSNELITPIEQGRAYYEK